jgi:hypothetical protein
MLLYKFYLNYFTWNYYNAFMSRKIYFHKTLIEYFEIFEISVFN